MSSSVFQFPEPKLPQINAERACTFGGWFAVQESNLSLGNLSLFYRSVICLPFALEGDTDPVFQDCKRTCPLLLKESLSLSQQRSLKR